jgi:hypothetical protein
MQHSLNLSKPTILKLPFREISCTKHNPGTYSTRLARNSRSISTEGQLSTQYSERFMCQKKNQPIHNKKNMQPSLNLSKPTILKLPFREISCTKHNPGTYSTRLARIFTFHIDRRSIVNAIFREIYVPEKESTDS